MAIVNGRTYRFINVYHDGYGLNIYGTKDTDIKGGQNAGLDTCWFNLKNEENKSNIHPKFEIGSYEDLYKIVMEPEELENIGVRNRRHSNEA